MYCTTCGHKLQDAVNFCPSCGASQESSGVATMTEPQDTDRFSASSSAPVLKLQPTFVPALTILSIMPFHLFMTLWGAMFFGGFATAGLGSFMDFPKWLPFVVAGSIFFFGIPLVAYLTKLKTYAKTKYTFYASKLEYYEGFFTVEEKTIDYANVTEVNLRKGIFQKMYGLGTIVLSTPATTHAGGRVRSGIHLADIPNPDRVYRQVKDLLKRF